MSTVTLQGKPLHTIGELPKIRAMAPDFTLTKNDLSETHLTDYLGKKIILNIFPSIDTPTCASSVRHFNTSAAQRPNVQVLCISADLPFAQKRFCGAENITNVITASVFRHPEFGKAYGVTLKDGPLAGLLSRAVVVINEKGDVIYHQQIPEITQEPDYDAALAALES